MDTARTTVIRPATGTSARRADAGSMRLSERDVARLLLAADMNGTPTILLPSSWTWRQPGCASSWPAGAAPDTPPPGGLAPARRGAG